MVLLYDKQGNRFAPSHATKKGRRYRYYASQAVITNARNKSGGPVRIPALEIEELVISQLTLLLRSPQHMMDILVDIDSSLKNIKAVTEASQEWNTAITDEIQNLLRSTVKRIFVHNESIEIQLDKSNLRQTVLGTSEEDTQLGNDIGEVVVISATAQLKRCGGEVRLIYRRILQAKPNAVPSLIRAISRAHDWVDRILRSEIVNQRTIAKETGLDERYISRVIPLAFLAPDLTEAILEGQAAHLSLETCLGNIPEDRSQQRMQLLDQ